MQAGAGGTARSRALFARLIARYDQGRVLKAVFYGLLAGVVVTLFLDYRQLAQMNALSEMSSPSRSEPVLPSAAPRDGEPLRPEVETPGETLRQNLAITLEKNGVLRLAGTIYPGASDAFAREIARIGEYVSEIDLDSPGGAVNDAISIGRMIRERGLSTRVEKGALCASSCPLVMAGGLRRVADNGATVGIHQIYALGGEITSPVDAMASAQATTARILSYLVSMDVDAALWTHAMETPPTRLYYLTHEEMQDYRLVGETAVAAAGGD